MTDDTANKFVKLCIDEGVLGFGDFELRSGRQCPYFFNFGAFSDGKGLARLGQYYADTIVGRGIKFDILFGPAYKGIPIAAATACALHEKHQRSVNVCYNRKEAKRNAEQGLLIGSIPPGAKILLIDDVLTSGSAAGEVAQWLEAEHNAQISALLVGIDRREHSPLRGRLDIHSLATIDHVIDHIRHSEELSPHLGKMLEYQKKHAIDGNAGPRTPARPQNGYNAAQRGTAP